MNDKKITAADLKGARWNIKAMGSGPRMHIHDYECAEYPRVTFRIIMENGKPDKQTMLVDGRDVGGSQGAADALNASTASLTP